MFFFYETFGILSYYGIKKLYQPVAKNFLNSTEDSFFFHKMQVPTSQLNLFRQFW